MTRSLRLSPIALEQLVQIEDYYAEVNPHAGAKILESIDQALVRVGENPFQFPICHFARDYRFSVVPDYRQYSVIYDFDNEFIRVHAVWDSRQDPQKLADALLSRF